MLGPCLSVDEGTSNLSESLLDFRSSSFCTAIRLLKQLVHKLSWSFWISWVGCFKVSIESCQGQSRRVGTMLMKEHACWVAHSRHSFPLQHQDRAGGGAYLALAWRGGLRQTTGPVARQDSAALAFVI